MKPNLQISVLLSLFLCICFFAYSQRGFVIKNYAVGYRIFEIDAVGTNPLDIYPFLKNPTPYTQFLNGIDINSVAGSPGPYDLSTFYLNAEIGKANNSLFWQKYSVQGGVFLTKHNTKNNGFVEHLDYKDTMVTSNKYSVTKNIQFAGINFGIKRNWQVSKRVLLSVGIQAQGGIPVVNKYGLRRDSSVHYDGENWQTIEGNELPDLIGKKYFEWQLMIPLSAQYQFYKNQLALRVELLPGIVGNQFRSKNFASREAHGAGVWLIYQPLKKYKR